MAQAGRAGGGGGAAADARRCPTGRGGGQPREWYRGLPIPPEALANFSRRNNTNYMETGVLSGLQLTSMFPNLVVDNFYRKTQNSIDVRQDGAAVRLRDPRRHADMTRVGDARQHPARAADRDRHAPTPRSSVDGQTFPAGSYVIKRDQPYGRLAKNLLERQNYPDPNLTTYDDSGWTMGLAMGVDVKEIKDKAILDVAVDAGRSGERQGQDRPAPAPPASPSRTTARTT